MIDGEVWRGGSSSVEPLATSTAPGASLLRYSRGSPGACRCRAFHCRPTPPYEIPNAGSYDSSLLVRGLPFVVQCGSGASLAMAGSWFRAQFCGTFRRKNPVRPVNTQLAALRNSRGEVDGQEHTHELG